MRTLIVLMLLLGASQVNAIQPMGKNDLGAFQERIACGQYSEADNLISVYDHSKRRVVNDHIEFHRASWGRPLLPHCPMYGIYTTEITTLIEPLASHSGFERWLKSKIVRGAR
jgi:hypothetical protein